MPNKVKVRGFLRKVPGSRRQIRMKPMFRKKPRK